MRLAIEPQFQSTPGLQGVLSSSSTIVQLRAFARVRGPEGRLDKEIDWEVLYLALRCGYYQEAAQVPSGHILHIECCLFLI